jgi:hypothetical protein
MYIAYRSYIEKADVYREGREDLPHHLLYA